MIEICAVKRDVLVRILKNSAIMAGIIPIQKVIHTEHVFAADPIFLSTLTETTDSLRTLNKENVLEIVNILGIDEMKKHFKNASDVMGEYITVLEVKEDA